jgi:hypothetical protein
VRKSLTGTGMCCFMVTGPLGTRTRCNHCLTAGKKTQHHVASLEIGPNAPISDITLHYCNAHYSLLTTKQATGFWVDGLQVQNAIPAPTRFWILVP